MKPRNIFFCLFSHFSIFHSMKFTPFLSPLRKTQSHSPNINGFYGLIGPNIIISKKLSLFDIFTGNGVFQTVLYIVL